MPRGDGTGPMEMGPMTGHGAGLCAGRGIAGFASSGQGLGFGRGRGGQGRGGRGRRNMFHATGLTGWQRAAMGDTAATGSDADIPTKQQEVEALKQQATSLAEMLDGIRQRIDKIES
jgi:Spy/CpxP family protein refolding chaperone